MVYEYANHLVRNGHAATIVYLQQLRKPSSHHFPLTLFSRLDRHRARLACKRGKPEIGWYSVHRDVKLVKATDLEARRVPNADAIFATAWQIASRVSECPSKKGAKFCLVQDFPPWLGDKHELEQTWRLPLKKICISSWIAELGSHARVPKEDIDVIPDAIDHDRFRVINSIRGRAKRVVMLHSSTTDKRSQLGLSVLLKRKDAVPNLEASLFGRLELRPAALHSLSEYYGSVSESELIRLYNAASIYHCSSAAEGFALPPASALPNI